MTRTNDSASFATGQSFEPLALLTSALPCPASVAETQADVHAVRLEFSSRGDRVNARLLLPASSSAPCPVVVVLGDAGQDHASPSLDATSAWLERGLGVITLDLSLHGERSSAKFSERLFASIARVRDSSASEGANAQSELDPNSSALLEEFVLQSVIDLSRLFDAAAHLPQIDSGRIGIAGIGFGGVLAAAFASQDTRAVAVALAHCGAVHMPEIDPQIFAATITETSLLLIEEAQSDAGDALFAACGEPKSRATSKTSGGGLGDEGIKIAGDHFAAALG
ncbi:MAG: dienelactone hydrolase [Myxococcota bacterium]|jgi:dienelactone hydrolase